MAHFKKHRPDKKKYWVDWFRTEKKLRRSDSRPRLVELIGHERWQKWKSRYLEMSE